MKKLFFSVVAFATLLFAASCQQESLEPVAGDGSVTYTVQMPGSIATKAVGDDLAADYVLFYEVYRAADIETTGADPLYEGTADFGANGVAEVSLQFVKRQKYEVLFWAQAKNHDLFDVTDLRAVKMTNVWAGNDLAAAVFAGTDEVNDCVSEKKGNVTLVRPVSQINIATSKESLKVGGTGAAAKTIAMKNATVTVKGLYATYNVYTKAVINDDIQDVAFETAPIKPEENANLPEYFDSDEKYVYVAMNYVGFAPEQGTTVDVEFTLETSESIGEAAIDHMVANVPIKANYRTNILGNLITEENAYTVTIDTQWADNGGNLEFVTDGLVKNLDGVYDVTSAKGLAYAINNLFEEGGNFYLTESVYDLTDFAVLLPNVPAGVTLNLYGEAHVVTRSSVTLGGVTIVGLPATTTGAPALINSVAEGAAVSVSGVTLADDNSVLVNENNGSVVVSETVADTIIADGNDPVAADQVMDLQTLQAALASGVKEVLIAKPITTTGDVTINLNGKTVKALDESTASYAMITNKGTLIIKGEGTLQLEATNDRGWSAFSSVISNTVGGHLTVNKGVVIEHLGGTSMAYGIDNLTNGKGTSAITVVNGATVKSTYRAIRQFLNGAEATNELYVKAGSVVSGLNKAIWMQDPSINSNTGKLVVEDGAKVGKVYFDVTLGSTEWPVEVSIAKSALTDGDPILDGVPAGYVMVIVNGCYEVFKMSTVGNADELVAALVKGENVKFSNDIKIEPASMSNAYGTTGININNGQTIDGSGYTLNIKGAGGTWDSGINTTGGLIKDLTVTGSFRGIFINHTSNHSEKVVLENVTIDGTVYTISCDQGLYQNLEARNSTFKGWTSYAKTLGEAKFVGCTFGEGSGYAFCRPYAPTTFIDCEFEAGFELDPVAKVSFVNCTLGGSELNGSNLSQLVISNIANASIVAYANDCATLQTALKSGASTVVLENTIEISETVVLDLNGKSLTADSFDAFVAKAGAKLTLKNGKVTSHGAVVRALGGEVVIEGGEYVQTGTAASTPSTYRYCIDARDGGKITINAGEFKSNNGMINVSASSEVIVNDGKFENIIEKVLTRHFAYVSAKLTVNGGEFTGKANSSAGGCFFCGAASGCDIQVNGGKFTSLWTSGSVNRIFEVYYGGTINVTGGFFNSNGGVASFVTANTDETTKVKYPYIAK